MPFRLSWTLAAGVATLVLAQMANVVLLLDATDTLRAGSRTISVKVLDTNVQVQVLRELPESVTALATYRGANRSGEEVFVGTGPSGGVFRFSPDQAPPILTTIASGLGDTIKFGTCDVSSLAVYDLNQDGTPELLAQTSQILPNGRPRLYAWSLGSYPILLGMARPEIESSWSHGLGFVLLGPQETPRVFSTFCGYGELVEYQLTHETSSSGFHLQGISWRQVGQLPVSGEQALTADADNDGRTDLCIAAGYALGRAGIRIYEIGSQGIEAEPRHLMDESGRFGNVRFLVGDLEADGTNELVAWWCSGLSAGDCEMVRYRLGPNGLRERTEIVRGDADEIWPRDGQMALADIDQDGNLEVWFLTGSGNLWRYEPNQSPSATHVCVIGGTGGPLVASTPDKGQRQCLYLGRNRSVLRVQSLDR